MEIVSVVDEGLGHSSYVIGLGDGTALVVDPARFPDRQRGIAVERGWKIAWSADTHSHADYVSGSPELAADGVTFLASAGARLEVPHRALAAAETLALSSTATLRAIATPGHTPDHLSYLLLENEEPVALFSGGSLMVGAVGRTDLLGNEHCEVLARAMFRALWAELMTLPDELAVYPTHGAGSFCSAPAGSARTTTIGIERATNPLLSIDDEDHFVKALVRGLGSFPDYFRQLPERNRTGPCVYPSVPDLACLDVDTVRKHIAEGAALVDARPIASFACAHPTGALSIQHRSVFASWLGWLIDLDRPVVFVLDETVDRTDLVRQCLTVGHEAILGELAGGLAAWSDAGLPVTSIPIVVAGDVTGTLLDVRQTSEWDAGHIPDAVHVELGHITKAAIPTGPVTVMCGHGERAMTGASLLEIAGRTELTVLAGGPQDWTDATGLDLETT